MNLPANLDYPIVAIGDLHGHRNELERLIARLETLAEWPRCALVFLGDFVDRGPAVPETLDLVLDLLGRPAGGSAAMGNHDLALVRATGLDDEPPSAYWVESYRYRYEHERTFRGYLGRHSVRSGAGWRRDLDALKAAIPERHRAFLTALPWVVEAPGLLFLHNGLSPELRATASMQVAELHRRRWDRAILGPIPGTATDLLWQPDYPVWIGADRNLSENPLPFPGKVQVTGHERVPHPECNDVRIRIDTSGGFGSPTACVLRAADAEPEFVTAGG